MKNVEEDPRRFVELWKTLNISQQLAATHVPRQSTTSVARCRSFRPAVPPLPEQPLNRCSLAEKIDRCAEPRWHPLPRAFLITTQRRLELHTREPLCTSKTNMFHKTCPRGQERPREAPPHTKQPGGHMFRGRRRTAWRCPC